MSLRHRLGPKESMLWEEFLHIANEIYTNIQYDIKVKPDASQGYPAIDEYVKNWSDLNCPRIDVYATNKEGKPVIFEVRPHADFTAIASVLTYYSLLQATGQLKSRAELCILCRDISDINIALAKSKGINIYILEEGGKTPRIL